jgi:hypothetical protein
MSHPETGLQPHLPAPMTRDLMKSIRGKCPVIRLRWRTGRTALRSNGNPMIGVGNKEVMVGVGLGGGVYEHRFRVGGHRARLSSSYPLLRPYSNDRSAPLTKLHPHGGAVTYNKLTWRGSMSWNVGVD